MLTAIFGISGGSLGLIVNILVLFLFITWLALIYWTYLDAKRRLDDQVLIACATGASIFPFVGTIVYTILRPPEFLDDVHERELEIRAAELRVRQLIEQSCPHCEYPIERSYLRCPNCEHELKHPCRRCRKPLDPKWSICPYCEAQVPRPKVEPERAAKRVAAPRAASPQRPRPAPGRSAPRPAQRPVRPTARIEGRPQR